MSDIFSPRIGARHETARKLRAHPQTVLWSGKEKVDEIREKRENLSALQSFADVGNGRDTVSFLSRSEIAEKAAFITINKCIN